jgi:hypothetical protein
MADHKNPVYLRVLIVVVALFLGLSLNMFQFRNPFRSLGLTPPTSARAPEPSKFMAGQGQEPQGPTESQTLAPMGQDLKSQEAVPPQPSPRPAPEAPAQASPPVAKAGEAPAAAPQDTAAKPAAAEASSDAPQAAPQAQQPAPESAPEPVMETARDNGLSQPAVTSDEGKVRSAKLGRQVPAEAASPVQASPAQPAAKAQEPAPAQAKPGEPQSGDSASAKVPAKAEQVSGPSVKDHVTAPKQDGQPANGLEKPAATAGGKVLEIKVQENPGEFVITIVTDAPIERVTSFHAKGPARLAVDLWGPWQAGGAGGVAVPGGLLEKVRLGAHPDKLRVVIDYRDKDLAVFSEPVIEKQPKGVVVKVPKPKAAQ